MVNNERLISEFIRLIRIDSLSKQERNMADTLKETLCSMGYEPVEDDAGEKIGGSAGNVICTVFGNKDIPAVLLMAHMDTVEPGIGKIPVLENDSFRADGNTVLGGDDVAGIVIILETLRILKEKNIPHGDIQIIFTVAEEMGCLGAKHLDFSQIDAKYGIVLDSGGSVGGFVISEPSRNVMDIIIRGKAAHAGVEPEKGINAIQIASEAITLMRLGRIDEETTASLGMISGGIATNIVCDRVEIKAEARSRNQVKLDKQTEHMRACFQNAADLYHGSLEFTSEQSFQAFHIDPDSGFMQLLAHAAEAAGVEFKTKRSGGGSDASINNERGILTVDMCVGMEKIHSVNEKIQLQDMVKTVELLIAILKNMD